MRPAAVTFGTKKVPGDSKKVLTKYRFGAIIKTQRERETEPGGVDLSPASAGWALKPPPRNRKVTHHRDRVERPEAISRGIEMEGKATARLLGGQARNFDLSDPSDRRRYSRRGFAPRNPSDARGDETCPQRQGQDEKTPSRWRAEQRARRATRAGPQASTRRAVKKGNPRHKMVGSFLCIFFCKNEYCQKVHKNSDFGGFQNR